MTINLTSIWSVVVPIILFPLFFQEKFLMFAWGNEDSIGLMVAKRILLLLPVLAFIIASWISILCGFSLIVRPNRTVFLRKFFLTWLDLGKSFFYYWGGIGKLVFYLIVWTFALIQLIVVGIMVTLVDVILAPFRALAGMGQQYLKPGIPWIAVTMTLLWSALEAFIFMIVLTPMVTDLFSNLTGEGFSTTAVRIPLYFFLLFFVLGSYVMVSTWTEAIKTKDTKNIIVISAMELLVMMVEVMFLYREFVDALVPWFAQHAGDDFELGIFGTILIASFVWLGVRVLSWFLFAAHGTPTIMAIIQRSGVSGEVPSITSSVDIPAIGQTFMNQIKKELDWVHQKGEEMLGAVVLPPVHVFAAVVNFCSLLVGGGHLFSLPIKNLDQLRDSNELLRQAEETHGNPG